VNVDEMQKKLSQKATKESEHRFENLYGLLCNEIWLRVAAHKTLQNKGSGTAGIDGKTKSNFLGDFDEHITSLKELLATKTFEPQPVKRVYIPKPNSEKKRPLGIPICLAYCISLLNSFGNGRRLDSRRCSRRELSIGE
jgi:RNA-directed DNA polymerase